MTEPKAKKAKKPRAPASMKLKKATTKAPKGVHPYKVRFGTRNEFEEPRSYPTSSKAKQAIVKELKAWQPWCIRFNNAGLAAITDALAKTDEIVFHQARDRISCCFDEHTETWLVAEYWIEEKGST
jgi:hypothetical protein